MNFSKKTVKLKRPHLHHKNSEEEDSDSFSTKNSFSEEEVEMPAIVSNEGYYWIGKEYTNTYKADFKDIARFATDQFNRLETPRMPWRDQGIVLFGESARDVARHFIQRWNQCKREKVKNVDSYPFLLPKQYSDKFDYRNHLNWLNDPKFTCDIQVYIDINK